MFPPILHQVLEELTKHPPQDEAKWDGPWNAILATLFPGHFVSPLGRISKDSYRTPYLLFEVSKPTNNKPPRKYRTVLVVAVMNYPDWHAGVPFLEAEINRQADAAFTSGTIGTAISKLYWVGAIGPHWQYGIKDQGQELKPLIAWHGTIHDEASYDDFKDLAALITDM